MPIPEACTGIRMLVVEGRDECGFFECYMQYLGVGAVQIIDAAGKNRMKADFPALTRMSGFDRQERIGIIRDADSSAASSFQSVCQMLKSNDLPVPSEMGTFTDGEPSVGVFILPNNDRDGSLEDVCLGILKSQETYTCVDAFASCVEKLEEGPRNLSKCKTLAYLSAMPKNCNNIGLGAKQGYWDFDSPALNDLKRFVESLI